MKKNIAFIIYSLNSGGAERVVSTLSNGLSNVYNVTIITIINTKPFYQLNDSVNVISCESNANNKNNFITSLTTNYNIYKNIKNICKNQSIDILIGFMTTTNILTILAAKRLKKPVIVSERIYPVFGKLSKFWRIMRRITYPKTDVLVVQTKPILEYFNSYIKTERLKILANPISSKLIEAKNNIHIPKENIILNVGRLTNQKGQDIVIKAFSQINPSNWQLHLVGEGPKRKEYTNLINQLGMKDKILLTGRNNEISRYYLRSKIFVFPSRFEGFPNALTEAMYMGLPSISTDCPTGPSELIKDGMNGFLTPLNDINLFSEKIKELIDNTEMRDQMGRNAAKSVIHLEENKVVKEWQKLISVTLNNS